MNIFVKEKSMSLRTSNAKFVDLKQKIINSVDLMTFLSTIQANGPFPRHFHETTQDSALRASDASA